MLFSFATVLPFFVCVILFITSLLNFKSTKGRGAFCILLGAASIYFFCEMHYLMTNWDFKNFALLDTCNNFIALCISPLIYNYMRGAQGKNTNVLTLLYLIPALAIGGISAAIYFEMGADNAAAYHESRYAYAGTAVGFDEPIYRLCDLWCINIFDIMLLIELIITIIILLGFGTKRKFNLRRYIRFLRGKDTFKPLDLLAICLLIVMIVSAIRSAIGPFALIEHNWISIVLSLITALTIFVMGFIERRKYEEDVPIAAVFDYYNWIKTQDGSEYRLRQAQGGIAQNAATPDSSPNQNQEQDRADTAERREEQADDSGVSRAEKTQEQLLLQFNEYMETQRPYLNPNFGIKDVTEELRTNKTYISNLVNQVFHLSFRDYINKKRIEHAKMLLRANRRAGLEEIASQSGFLSASQFNKKFKELEGFTPSHWRTLKKED